MLFPKIKYLILDIYSRCPTPVFNDVVSALNANMDVDEAIYSCAQTRNTIGHNLVWSTTDLNSQTYDLLVKNIGISCIHAISKLYT